jgi:3',5'-cyclic AMP phosphodiesterase CpdA
MRTLAHLSDLHFGRVDPALLGPLRDAVHASRPDVVVVSGDLTQRARPAQFAAARAFLAQLPGPQIVVPGNHDVPLYDVARRFLAPLARFRRSIAADLAPWYRDGEIAVLGINSARALAFKGGRINAEQVALVRERFGALPAGVIRVLVTHHPFELPPDADADDRIGRAAMALDAFAECGVDILLSGHLHRTHMAAGGEAIAAAGALSIHAGTAASTRGRGETNAYNLIAIAPGHAQVTPWRWDPRQRGFVPMPPRRFARRDGRWGEQAATPAE